MDSTHILGLAFLQGITEFLPISSSAHLILAPRLLGFADQGLAFDVAVHLGSLLAVITYFQRELKRMSSDFIRSLGNNGKATENSRMVWMIIVASLPIMLAGLLMISLVQGEFRSIGVIATTTVLFGLLLLWADIKGPKRRDEYSVNLKDALIIGGMQILSLIPGTSRSGITITAGMMLGMTRQGASRFSFLLSIPTILMSGSMVSLKLLQSPLQVDWYALLLGAVLSFAAAFLCIHFFLRLIQRYSMTPFVIYRLFLGGILFGLII